VGSYTYVAYEATEGTDVSRGDVSRIWLARVGPGDEGQLIERLAVSPKGEIAAWPSIAEDSDGGIWVAWTACRGGKWAVMASRVEGTRAAGPVRLSRSVGLAGQARAASEGGMVCFVWAECDREGHRVVARIHDGKLGKAFTVYDGRDPVGRPDVHVAARDRLVFAWDECIGGRFAIRCREMVGTQLGAVVTLVDSVDAWEPRIAGLGGNYAVSWHQVPAGRTTGEPGVWLSSGAAPALGLAESETEDTWRVRSVSDAGGAPWIAWTTRVYGFNTRFFAKPLAGGAIDSTTGAYTIDIAMERNFMNTFDCTIGDSLAIVWDYSGSVYLAKIGLEELRAGARGGRGGAAAAAAAAAETSGPGRRGVAAPDGDWEGAATDWTSAGQTTGRRRAGVERRTICYRGDRLGVYFGDCHNHTSFSDGRAYPDMSLALARDARGLDFAAITDHDVSLMPAEFAWIETLSSLVSERGRFAVLYGFEASKGWAQNGFGHWNVLFAGAGRRGGQSGSRVLHFEEGMEPGDLYRFARRGHAIAIPHHVAKRFAPHDWTYFDPVAEPVVEICSLHGVFESHVGNEGKPDMVEGRFIENGLGRGYVFGFVGGSDSHNCFEAARVDQGLTGVYAEDLSPEAIFEAFERRRTFALTGGRVILDFRCDGHLMGEEVVRRTNSAAPLVFEAYAASADSIVSVEVVGGAGVVYAWPGAGGGAAREEVKVSAEIAPPDSQTYYYLRAATAKGDRAWSSPVWIKPRR
jgi:hypothetical protein